MKKILFVDIPMQPKSKVNYSMSGNVKNALNSEVLYPLNSVLPQKIASGDELRIVLLETKTNEKSHDMQTKENSSIFETEIRECLAGKNAKIEIVHFESEFDESKETHEVRFRKMLDMLEKDAELYADITFGPRLIPMLVLCVFNFAERFYGSRIKGIFYGKVLHDLYDNKKTTGGAVFDVTSLYYLNSMTNSMLAADGEYAKKTLDEFFAL